MRIPFMKKFAHFPVLALLILSMWTFNVFATKPAVPVKPVADGPTAKKPATATSDDLIKYKKVYAVLEMESEGKSLGKIKIHLQHIKAPETVKNFVELAEGTKFYTQMREGPDKGKKVKGKFFDGLTFHRVISGFMIQGGDPLGNSRGGPGSDVKVPDEIQTDLFHDKAGVVSMANAGVPNSAGSQFFITLAPQPDLDKGATHYTIFGEVVEGLDVVKAIGRVKTGINDKPIHDVVMKHVTIIREK
jgi:peptidyl-prolyl cis-trans isomerase A (cyclophilin A)